MGEGIETGRTKAHVATAAGNVAPLPVNLTAPIATRCNLVWRPVPGVASGTAANEAKHSLAPGGPTYPPSRNQQNCAMNIRGKPVENWRP